VKLIKSILSCERNRNRESQLKGFFSYKVQQQAKLTYGIEVRKAAVKAGGKGGDRKQPQESFGKAGLVL
jgi:hypothetical protein